MPNTLRSIMELSPNKQIIKISPVPDRNNSFGDHSKTMSPFRYAKPDIQSAIGQENNRGPAPSEKIVATKRELEQFEMTPYQPVDSIYM